MKEEECTLLQSELETFLQQQGSSCLDSIAKQGDVLQKIGNLQALVEIAAQSGRPEQVSGMTNLLDQLLDVVRGILLAQDQQQRKQQFPSLGIWGSSTNDVAQQQLVKVEDWLGFHYMDVAAEAKPNNHVEDELYDDLVELEATEILAEHTHFCGICGKGFKRDANLRMHMRGHGEAFKSPSALSKPASELATGSLPRRRRYSCPFVGCKRNREHKKFVPLKTMLCVKNHYKRSHCPKRLVCSRCGVKKFAVLADLKTHEKHCGTERWQCSCGTTFSRKDKLLGHVALFVGHSPVVKESSPTPIIVMPQGSASSSSLVSSYSNPGIRQSSSLQKGDSSDCYQLQQQGRVLQQLDVPVPQLQWQELDRHQVPLQQQDVLSSDSSASGSNDNEDDHNSSTDIVDHSDNGWLFDDLHQDNNKMLNDLEFLGLDFFIS